MNDPHPEQRDPDTACPDWCEMHIDGRHVGPLTLDGSVKGSNVYTRWIGHDDGEVGIEVVVARVNGGKKDARVELTPDDIAQHTVATHAMEKDLRDSLDAFEAGTPVCDDGDHPNR